MKLPARIRRISQWYLDLPVVKKLSLSYLTIILIPIILLSILANKVSTDTIIRKTIHNSVQNLNVITESFNGLFDYVENISAIIVATENIQVVSPVNLRMDKTRVFEFGHLIRDELDTIIQPRKIISSVVVYLDNGNIFATPYVDTNRIPGERISSRQFHDLFEQNWGRAIFFDTHPVDYEIERGVGNFISLMRPVISVYSSDIVGRIEMNISEEAVSRVYESIAYGRTGRFIVVNRAGEIISSSNKSEIYQDISQEPYFTWTMENNLDGEIFKIGGKSYLVTVQHIEKMSWLLVGLVPLNEVTDDLRQVTYFIFGICLFCILLSLPLSLLFSKIISKPIIELSEKMTLAGQGDLEVRVDFANKDEIGSLSSSFNLMLEEISSLMDEIYTEQVRKKSYELMALQAQIKPHFLYNTLESVCSLVQMDRKEDSFRMVKALAMFYRTSLSDGRNIITVAEELEILKNYLLIQAMRHQDLFTYRIDIDNDLMSAAIIKLTVQPLVENSIYHGFREKGGKGHIEVTSEKNPAGFTIYVEDNGIGFTKRPEDILTQSGDVDKPAGFGLRSVDSRIKLHFGAKYGLKVIRSDVRGTLIAINLPWGKTGNGGQVQ